ncbi:MAG: manganese-dependent inorganic pyrophosphatase [Solirubrobacteraceae bacterium]|jgi:manganese-dependent inorganic pyrophosphatase|nr:manganese-dependent inorganic pyrophosphatase [Solirubrobacteraceae bacterium]
MTKTNPDGEGALKRPHVYVCGHRNPDTDSVASAIAYAELKNQTDETYKFVPVRLGHANAQTQWLIERSGAKLPDLLSHVKLRVRDVMRVEFPVACRTDAVREVGLKMAGASADLVPIVDDAGVLCGVLTERALARRYIRESREASRLDVPTALQAIVDVLQGRLLTGEDRLIRGRVWVQAMDNDSPSNVGRGDVVVVGDRPDSQERAILAGIALLVTSNGTVPDRRILELASAHGTSVVASSLDSYVTSRMITLSEPCHALIEGDPLTVGGDDLVSDIADQIKDVHYRAAVAVDSAGRPVGLVTRADLVRPALRRVLLVDHAERAQSVPGVEEAEIVEILDHHHIGSIETKLPVRATFDPVGSTATLVTERFRQAGIEPALSTATMLLGAIVSDTVLLTSPTTTPRDRTATTHIEGLLGIEATAFGREMFERSSDVSHIGADELVLRDLKEYQLDGARTIGVAQIETVGGGLLERTAELLEAIEAQQARRQHVLFALMLTDVLARHTVLLVAGSDHLVEHAFGRLPIDGSLDLPGVMSRKKQVAPPLLAAAASAF